MLRAVISMAALALALDAVPCIGAEMASVGFADAVRCSAPPALDGKLDEDVWKTAPPSKVFYVYCQPRPGPGLLKTEYRMLYDDQGVYLGIVNYEKNVAGMRKVYTERDAESLWTDDCNEIYFDSFGTGIGWTKFVVNSLGTMADARRVDSAIILPDWNGSGWLVKTGLRDDAWVVEAFFPWSDLGRRAEHGSLWRFCLVRYAWPEGKFVGVTSSPGGYYNNPQNFGVIRFSGEKPDNSPEALGRAIGALIAPPWFIPLDEGVLECETAGKFRLTSIADVVARESQKRKLLADEVDKFAREPGASPELAKLAEEFGTQMTQAASIPSSASDAASAYAVYRDQVAATAALQQIYWRIRVLELLDRQK